MAKTFQTTIAIGGKVNPSLAKAFGFAQSQAGHTAAKMNALGGVAARVGGMLAGAFSIYAVVDFGKKSVTAYNESAAAATKLTTIMEQRMKATPEQIEQIQKLAAAQQRLGIIEDDTQIAGAQQLATFLKLPQSLNTLIPAMNNLAAQQKGVSATGQDLTNIANMMGKVLADGNTGALKRVGITFTQAEAKALKFGNEQQRVALLAQIITNNVGNMNVALAATKEGRLQNVKNQLDDIKERIGEGIMGAIEKLLPKVQELMPKFALLADKVTPLLSKFADTLLWAADNADTLKTVVIAVTGAFVAYNVVLKSAMIISAISKAWAVATAVLAMFQSGASLATVAQWALNAAFYASPIGWVALAVAGLTAAFILLWNKCEGFRNFFIGMWEGIKIIWEKLFGGGDKNITATVNMANKAQGFANGATISRPTYGVVGEGKYTETIIPHSNTPRSRALLTEAARGVGVGTGGNVTNISYSPTVYANDATGVAQVLADDRIAFENKMREFGAEDKRLAYGY